MSGFGVMMLIFGTCIFLVGLYTYTGHYSELLFWRTHMKDKSKKYLKYLGRIIMAVGLSPILTAIVTLFVDENSIIPAIFLIASMMVVGFIAAKTNQSDANNNSESKK